MNSMNVPYILLPRHLKICFPSGNSQTGMNSFFPGTSRSSVTRCKPGANCPSSHSSVSRQLSPLSVTEDSSAPILELQSRGSSGVCGHRAERQNRSGMWVNLLLNNSIFGKLLASNERSHHWHRT